MPLGFKIADGYVEIHADYDKNELRDAAQDAADAFDKDFSKQAATKSASGTAIADGIRKDVERRRPLFRRIGRRIGLDIRDSMWSVPMFGRQFIEAITFGQADFARLKAKGPLSAGFGRMGTALGVIFAGAFVLHIANAVTALLPLALGAALLAVPIADLIARNVDLKKGKLSFKDNAIGNALKGFIRQAQQLADAMGKVFQGPFIKGLKSATALFKQLEGPLTRAVKAISPGAVALWNGLLGAVVSFGRALAPALPAINAGLKQWGIELPKIGAALGKAFATILGSPELVAKAVSVLSGAIQWLVGAAAKVVNVLTWLLAGYDSFNRALRFFRQNQEALGGSLPAVWNRIVQAFAPVKKALDDVWAAFKRFALATSDHSAAERLRVLVDKIKAVWSPLKTFLGQVWDMAWTKIKEIWNSKVIPWWNNTAKPSLTRALKSVAKIAFAALVSAAKAELAKLPGKAKAELDRVKARIVSSFKDMVAQAKSKAKQLVDSVVTFLKSLPGKAAGAISGLWGRMTGAFTRAATGARQKAQDLVTRFVTFVRTLPGKAAAALSSLRSRITGALAGAGSWLVSAGRSIITGLASGIRGAISGAVSAAASAARAALNAAKSALGISSPSKVFAEEVGKPIAQGIGLGMNKHLPGEMGGLRGLAKFGGMQPAYGARSVSNSSQFSPSVHVTVQAGLDPIDAGARRALVKALYLELDKFQKDYVIR